MNSKRISSWHSPEYFSDRQPILDAFNAQIQPIWAQFLNGEVTYAEYLALIAPFTKQYLRDVLPVWNKHGGPK